MQAIDSNTKSIIITGHKPSLLPIDTIQKNLKKRRARKLAQRTLAPNHITQANRFSNELKQILQNFQQDRWETKMQYCNKTPKDIFRLIKKCKRERPFFPPQHKGINLADKSAQHTQSF